MGARLSLYTGEKMSNIVAIIPARKGSKRLPNKNIRCFNGVPLLDVTVDQALESGVFSQVYITTDIDEYTTWKGVITRPPCLADDRATTNDVVLHALWSMPSLPDAFVVLQPTSPLRRPEDYRGIVSALTVSGHIISYAPERNGAFYAMTTQAFMFGRDLKDPLHYKYFMPSWTQKYIDTFDDFIECERLYKLNMGEK